MHRFIAAIERTKRIPGINKSLQAAKIWSYENKHTEVVQFRSPVYIARSPNAAAVDVLCFSDLVNHGIGLHLPHGLAIRWIYAGCGSPHFKLEMMKFQVFEGPVYIARFPVMRSRAAVDVLWSSELVDHGIGLHLAHGLAIGWIDAGCGSPHFKYR